MKGGEQRPESQGFKNYVGFGKTSVVSINADTEDKEGNEISYVKEVKRKFKGVNEEGKVEPIERDVEELTLVFKLKVDGVENTLRHSIRIYNVQNVSYKDYENTGKIKYEFINQTGNTAWAFDESELKDKFKYFMDKDGNKLGEKTFRKALVGESELFTLLNAWVGDKIRKRFITWDYEVDTQQLFRKKFNSLTSFVDSEFASPFLGMYYVEVSEDGEKFYQKLFSKAFLKPDFIKYINNGFTFPDKYSRSNWEYFTKQVESPDNLEYALKGFYTYAPIKEYNPEEDVAASASTKHTMTAVDDGY